MGARVAAAIVIACALAAAGVARSWAGGETRTGFDHLDHNQRVAVLGDPIACERCHAIGAAGALAGRPDHRTCFGACHGPAPRGRATAAQAASPLCTACHARDALAADRRPPAAAPPFRLDPDFGLTLDHARHTTAGAACTACHAIPGAAPARPAPPHARCATCHAGQAAPAMSACTACHPAAYGENAKPRLAPGELAVGGTYDHRKHRARAPGAAALACETCHAAIATATDTQLASPAKPACTTAGCHDGAAAFSTTAGCRACHTAAPAARFAVVRPTARFSHAAHAARAPLPACGDCHAIDRGGEARAPGHAACAGCHADDFAARRPTTCGACHLSTEPWRALRADQVPAPRSEYGASLSHAAHATIACEDCHRLDTATRELRPPRGHAACARAGCHQASAGPAPRLDACEACHQPGLEAARDAARTAAPWSVRARFRHAPHRRDADAGGAALPCTRCHAQVTGATSLDAIAPPAKPTCAPCHDGARAFKMTGHGCARCHGG